MKTNKPIQIFKPGTHTAMSGAVLAFSESDLAACAAAYDPAKHEAPLVVGHPKHDAPAYGWVKHLAFAEGALDAAPDQVDAAFAEMVDAGRFKKISASFYSPDSPQNPVPGVYYLRHVGFLGAQPPAVKGLRAPEFADNEEGVIEFADWGDMQNASLWRGLREWIIGKFGMEEADKVVPNYSVASLEEEARKELPAEPALASPAYAETVPPNQETNLVKPEQAAALEAENAQLKQRLNESDARDKAAKTAERHAGHAAFAETLVLGGRLLPAQKDVAVATLDFMADQETVIEFGEGDNKKPLVDAFKAFLESLPKQIEFSEVAGAEQPAAETVSFAAPPGYTVDTERLEIHTKALQYQRAHNVGYDQALAAVSQ